MSLITKIITKTKRSHRQYPRKLNILNPFYTTNQDFIPSSCCIPTRNGNDTKNHQCYHILVNTTNNDNTNQELVQNKYQKSLPSFCHHSHSLRNSSSYNHGTTNITTTTNSISSSSSSSSLSTWLSHLSIPRQAELEQLICNTLQQELMDPILQQDWYTLNFIQSITFPKSSPITTSSSSSSSMSILGSNKSQDDNLYITNNDNVVVTLSLPTLLHPHLDKMKQRIVDSIKNIISNYASVSSKSKQQQQNILYTNDLQISIQSNPKNTPLWMNRMQQNHSHHYHTHNHIHTHEEIEKKLKQLGPGLKDVNHFVAVYSCKGGVGKSTVAINLAYQMAQMGGRVGLLDLDVYGPSLPVLIHPHDPTVRKSSLGQGMVKPIVHEGVKLLSLGFVSPTSGVPGSGMGGGAAVMRGPMAGRVVTQLLKGTEWGSLDVLIIDMPPGTGDIQLTLCQDIELSGCVCVTTPSKLALTDAKKGIEMFTSLGVPTISIVENMAYFECDGGKKHFPFGKSIKESSKTLETEYGLKESHIFPFPISNNIHEANENGSPYILSQQVQNKNHTDSKSEPSVELSILEGLAKTVASELLLLQYGKSNFQASNETRGSDQKSTSSPMVRFSGNDGQVFDSSSMSLSVDNTSQSFTVRLFSDSGAYESKIMGDKLRTWDPKDGNSSQSPTAVVEVTKTQSGGGCGGGGNHVHRTSSSRLFPCKVEKKGHYGFSVEWADGATIIYSMSSLAKAAGADIVNSN